MNEEANVELVKSVDGVTVEAIERANIDTQIATAHKYPRSMEKFQKRAMTMATLDSETAESCIYVRPVGKDASGKPIYAEGLSVRMAEIVGASYGNLRVGSILIEQTERQVKARGFAHDLESNFAASCEVVEATVDKYGKPYSERMRTVVAKACLAKARRDATFQVVPKALCKSIETEAKRVAVGDGATLEKRRSTAMMWIQKLGVAPERVFTALGIKGEADIGIEELTKLTGIKTAISDGDLKIEDAFPMGEMKQPERKPESDKAEPKEEGKKGDAESTPDKKTQKIVSDIKKVLGSLEDNQKEEVFKALEIDPAEEMLFMPISRLTALKSALLQKLNS